MRTSRVSSWVRNVFAAAILAIAAGAVFGQARSTIGELRQVTITTEPRARVWIDDVLYGTTSDAGSLKISTISPGRKVVRVGADGFKES